MVGNFATRDRLNPSTPTLVVMCGLSRTGKTTAANSLARVRNTVVFGMDDVRRAMGEQYNLAHEPLVRMVKSYAIAALLQRGYSVIADDTHLDRRSRRDTIMFIRSMVECDVMIEAVTVPVGAAYDRWMAAVDRDKFPRAVIEDQLNKYEAPDEVMDNVIVSWAKHVHGERV